MRIIGISHKTRYWQHYAFSNPPEGYRYARMVDFPWHMTGIVSAFLWHTRFFLPVKRADLFHTYNCIVANRHPWVIEVESYLPRYKPMPESHRLFQWGLGRLASHDCRALIYTSEHTLRMNRDKLVASGVDPAKMQVIYRAVEQYLPGEKASDHFTVLFAGNAFYRKGGIELLKAFQRLKRPDARLWIVSTLEVDWGHFPSEADKAWAERIIAEDPRITLWRGLGHADLIQRMRQAHVFVSTTFADPFNNTILEAMGTQLPIIGSQVSSLPEVVQHGRNGWLLQVEGRDSDAIADDLTFHLRQLMDDAALCELMGKASLAVVREKFDLRVRNEKIAGVYAKALGASIGDSST